MADHRAATPSAAAETAVPSRERLVLELRGQRQRLVTAIDGCLYEPRRRAQAASRELSRAVIRSLESRRTRLDNAAGRLDALSPLATLRRGYTVAAAPDGRTLASVADFVAGQSFTLRLRDGAVDATTVKVRAAGQQEHS